MRNHFGKNWLMSAIKKRFMEKAIIVLALILTKFTTSGTWVQQSLLRSPVKRYFTVANMSCFNASVNDDFFILLLLLFFAKKFSVLLKLGSQAVSWIFRPKNNRPLAISYYWISIKTRKHDVKITINVWKRFAALNGPQKRFDRFCNHTAFVVV